MTIHELLAAAGLTANDEIPIWDAEATGEPTKKITAANFASAVVTLANLVTGVKGNAESENAYRHGNVNLTPANIGAAPRILVTTVTATMDSNGNISLGLSANSYIVVAAKVDSLIVTPWASGGDGNWHARITGVNGGTITSGSVTATVYYQAL